MVSLMGAGSGAGDASPSREISGHVHPEIRIFQ